MSLSRLVRLPCGFASKSFTLRLADMHAWKAWTPFSALIASVSTDSIHAHVPRILETCTGDRPIRVPACALFEGCLVQPRPGRCIAGSKALQNNCPDHHRRPRRYRSSLRGWKQRQCQSNDPGPSGEPVWQLDGEDKKGLGRWRQDIVVQSEFTMDSSPSFATQFIVMQVRAQPLLSCPPMVARLTRKLRSTRSRSRSHFPALETISR
jgi:hypothetical protein